MIIEDAPVRGTLRRIKLQPYPEAGPIIVAGRNPSRKRLVLTVAVNQNAGGPGGLYVASAQIPNFITDAAGGRVSGANACPAGNVIQVAGLNDNLSTAGEVPNNPSVFTTIEQIWVQALMITGFDVAPFTNFLASMSLSVFEESYI